MITAVVATGRTTAAQQAGSNADDAIRREMIARRAARASGLSVASVAPSEPETRPSAPAAKRVASKPVASKAADHTSANSKPTEAKRVVSTHAIVPPAPTVAAELPASLPLTTTATARADSSPRTDSSASVHALIDSVTKELASLRREVSALRADRAAADSIARASRPAAPAPTTTAPAVSAAPAAPTPAAPAPTAPAPTKAPAAHPAPAAVAPSAPAPAKAPAAPPAPAVARTIESGFGAIKVGGLLQAWYTNGSLTGDNTIRIRRAELKLTGKISPKVSWALMVDPAKSLSLRQTTSTVAGTKVVTDESVNQSSRMLQDALITLALPQGYTVDVGQYKLPFAYEGPNSTSRVITVERPMFASDRNRGGSLADVRDIGATLRGKVAKRADIALGVFDGTGEVMNTTDANDQKVVVASAFAPIPILNGLSLGASGVYGARPAGDHARRDRLGAVVEYLRPTLTARGEYVRGVDGDIHRQGYYGLLAFKVSSVVELVQRYDFFDPDTRRATSSADEGAVDLLTGLNYYIAGHNAKLQLNAVHRSWQHDRVPASRHLLLNVQTSW